MYVLSVGQPRSTHMTWSVPKHVRRWMSDRMGKNLIEIKTRIPERAVQFINQLVNRGYYSSVADFARQSILDKLINDFELGISELEPDIVELKRKKKGQGENQK